MNARNPFASISNYSFLRNAQHLSSQGRQTRTHSSHKKYFDYQGSYMRDSYLRDWQSRRNQEEITSKVMGVEALRYLPLSHCQQDQQYPLSKDHHQSPKAEYYNLQNYQSPKDAQAQTPLTKSKSNNRLQKTNSFKQQNMYQSIASQRGMKSSMKDMFGSDYFNNRCAAVQSEEERSEDDKVFRKPTFLKKQNNNTSRFKVVKKESKQLSQLKEEEQSKIKTSIHRNQGQPETLYLKSRGKTFYRYHQPTY